MAVGESGIERAPRAQSWVSEIAAGIVLTQKSVHTHSAKFAGTACTDFCGQTVVCRRILHAMDEYDSDSSLGDSASGISTTVLLGYATKEPTDDPTNHLGGEPVGFSPSLQSLQNSAYARRAQGAESRLTPLNSHGLSLWILRLPPSHNAATAASS